MQRFQREAQAAAKLHHTNIVPIYAQGEHDGVYYYAMELIRGRSVYEIVEEARRGDSSALGVTETRPGGYTPAVGDEAAAGSSLGTTTWSRIRSRDTAEHFDTIARLTATVAEALEYAHQAGVIHPRCQTPQPDPGQRRAVVHHRLRAGQGHGAARGDHDRRVSGFAAVHVAGADQRRPANGWTGGRTSIRWGLRCTSG